MPYWGTSKYYYWYYEPDNVRIELEAEFRKKLIEKAIKRAGSISNLNKVTRLNPVTIFNYKRGISMSIVGLKKILDYLDINYDRINHKIKKISFDYTPNPRLYKKEISVLLAASLADGHLSDSQFMYKNKEKQLIQKVEKCIRKIFNNIKVTHKIAKNEVPYILAPIVVKRVLEKLGSPIGKKLFKNPRVPTIIADGSTEMKKLFIQQFFDDEGYIEKEQNRLAITQAVECTGQLPLIFVKSMILKKPYTTGKIPEKLKSRIAIPNLLIDIRKILKEEFGINFTFHLKRIAKYIHKDRVYVSAIWDLQCYNLNGIKTFKKKINFYSDRKKNELSNLIKKNRVPSRDIYCKILNLAINKTKEKGYFNTKEISKGIDLQPYLIRKRLNVFVKKGIFNNHNGKYTHNLELQ